MNRTNKGVKDRPSAKLHIRPCAMERSCNGSQALKALVKSGSSPLRWR
jgi:hypothetical protein